MNYRHPWNLATLAIGVALLIGRSFDYQTPDWENPKSQCKTGTEVPITTGKQAA